MKVIDQFDPKEPVQQYCFRRTDKAGVETPFEAELLSEHVLEIYVNGEFRISLTCIPFHLKELVAGRLLSEGVVKTLDDVREIHLEEDGHRIHVLLEETAHREPGLTPVLPRRWDPEEVFVCAEHFQKDTPIHRRTRSTHSCFLLMDGRIVFECEDIGRHNVLDKVLGWALLNGKDLTKAAVFVSGRLPFDMVLKVIRSRVPVLISKETATVQAVETARQCGLTMIGKARPDSFVVYSEAAGVPAE